MSENYLHDVIEELYEVIIVGTTPFPSNTPIEKKMRLLEDMLKYFESKDTIRDYKRCSKIQRYINILKISNNLKIYNNTSGSLVRNN